MTELRREHSRAVGRPKNLGGGGRLVIQGLWKEMGFFFHSYQNLGGGVIIPPAPGSNGPTIEYAAVAPPAPRPIRAQSHQ